MLFLANEDPGKDITMYSECPPSPALEMPQNSNGGPASLPRPERGSARPLARSRRSSGPARGAVTCFRVGRQSTPPAAPCRPAWPSTTPCRCRAPPPPARERSRALAEAQVQGNALVHGKLRWRGVVLPATDTLPLAAWENLARFWRAGGIVAVIGAR